MKEKDLRRRLGVLEATGLGIGAMIGGTIYAGTGIAMRISGGAADIAYLVAATIASLIAYSYAKLGGIVADSGGSYSIVSKIVGTRAGILVCTLQLAAYTIASAFYAVMAAEYASVALGLPEQEIALLMLATVVLLNVAGARESGLVEALISGLKLSILASIACYAAIVLRPSVTPPRGIVELFEASSMLFLGFEGFEVIASASGEMANPQRDVKVATAASLAAVGAVYTLLAYASRGLAEYGEYTILASLASSILGRVGVCVVAAGAVLSAFTALNANVYTVSRLLYALGRDGLAPRYLALTWRGRSPPLAVAVAGTMACALALTGALKALLALSNLFFLAIFASVSYAAIKAGEGIVAKASVVCIALLSASILKSFLL